MPEHLWAWARRLMVVAFLVLLVLLVAKGLDLLGETRLFQRLEKTIIAFILAAVIAYFLKPVVDLLGRWRIPRLWGALICFGLVAVFLWGFSVFVSRSVSGELKRLQPMFRQSHNRWPDAWKRAANYYEVNIPPWAKQIVEGQWREMSKQAGKWMTEAARTTWHSLSFLIELFLIPILVFYFLSDLPGLKDAVMFFVPPRSRTRTTEFLSEVDHIFGRYLQAQLLLALIAWVVVTIGLGVLGLPFYVTLGIIAGITRAIPVIGPIFGGIPIVLDALIFRSTGFALWVLLGFSLLHLLESKLLMPKVVGAHLRLHPVLIIVALMVGYAFFGILGMFVACPVLAVIKHLVEHSRKPNTESAEPATP